MATKNWQQMHTQEAAGFEVLSVRVEGNKASFDIEFDNEAGKVYTVDRNFKAKGGVAAVSQLDGCEIKFNRFEGKLISVKRLHDTSGDRSNMKFAQVQTKGKKPAALPKVKMPKPAKQEDSCVKHEKFETIKTCLEAGIPVYLAGPAGSGKNFTVEQICKELGWEFYFSNSVQQEYKLTGFIDAGGEFHDTEFFKACTSDNECVFFLDEMDASIPEVLVLLNAAIANGYFEFPTGRADLSNVHFVAAGNTVGNGADDLYSGRQVIDQATLDRFAIIDFNYDRNIELSISKYNYDLVDFIHQLRSFAEEKGVRVTFSYRCITMASKLEAAGMDEVQIIKIAVMKGLDKDTINTFDVKGHTKYHEALRDLRAAA